MKAERATYLDVTQMRLLNDWAQHVSDAFHGAVPYLVGSVLTTQDYRDVDVRLMLVDDDFDSLASVVDIGRLGFAMSLWANAVTRLHVDFQVQRMSDANRDHPGPRNALGLVAADRWWLDTGLLLPAEEEKS